jgi:hypothetical protein
VHLCKKCTKVLKSKTEKIFKKLLDRSSSGGI